MGRAPLSLGRHVTARRQMPTPGTAPRRTISAPSMTQPSTIALLGGTFDPPHIGHLFLAECARLQFAAQSVRFLPAGDPYKKSASTGLPAASGQPPTASHHRLAMLRLAIAGNPHFVVDDREIRRPGPSYTVDTLEELHAEGHTNLILLLGADALADLPTWKHPGRIFELATIAVAPKPWQLHAPTDEPPSPAGPEAGSGVSAGAPTGLRSPLTIAMPPLAISSTLIRARVARGQPIRYLLPDPVETYIRTHNLYAQSGSE